MMCFFFFNDTATTEIYTLSLHDALPILRRALASAVAGLLREADEVRELAASVEDELDRKSTRLNSSHANISYAVFCLKKKTHFARYSRTIITTSHPTSYLSPIVSPTHRL